MLRINHRAARQPAAATTERPKPKEVYGTTGARMVGATVATAIATVFEADGIVTSPQAMHAAAPLMRPALTTLANMGTAWSRPLREAGRLVGDALQVCPVLGGAAYLPEKLTDLGLATYGSLIEGMPWQKESAFVARRPAAPYPDPCDWDKPAPECPDPLNYLRAATLAPYVWAAVGVTLGAAIGYKAFGALWPRSVNWLAVLPEGAIPTVGPAYLRAAERAFVDAMLQAARRATQDMPASAQAQAREQQPGQAGAPGEAEPGSLEAGTLQQAQLYDTDIARSYVDAQAYVDEGSPLLETRSATQDGGLAA